MKFLLPLLCAAAVLWAAAARADNTADEADVAFSLGNQSYQKRDYEKALASYLLSHRLVPNRNVLFNIARCYEQLAKFDEAFRYYFELCCPRHRTTGNWSACRALANCGTASVCLKPTWQ